MPALFRTMCEKINFFLNVMLEPKIDLYIVAIPPPRDRD